MNLYPLHECAEAAEMLAAKGVDCYQQFQCTNCKTKQTIEPANNWHTKGKCEECGAITDMEKDGCNFMAIASSPEAQQALFGRILKNG